MPSTPAKTTVKVAVINNAAKDDFFQDLAWLQEDASLQGSLNVLGNDPGSAHLIGVSQSLPTSSADLTNHSSSFVPAGFSGSLSVSINAATGQLDVDASGLNNDLQGLGEGQTTSITFYYTAQMANGAYSTAKVTIEIEGTNDDPMFSAHSQLAGTINDTAADDTFASLTGTVCATDADGNDAGQLTYGLAAGETGTSAYGSFGIDSTGHWTFTPNDGAVEALKTTTHVSFNIQVSDGHGGSDTETVTITLNGVNDTATVGGNTAGSVTEDHTTTASGTVTASDRDAGDTGFETPASLAGTYGDFHFNAATGDWSYDLRNGDANVQALGADDSRTDTLEVTSADGSASETITVTIHGDNDAPEFDGTGTSGSLDDSAEDDTFAQVTGAVVATDKDASDTLTYGLADGETGTSAYGSFAIDGDGNWTFTPDDAAVEGLKDTTTVSFEVAVDDGHDGGDTETVTITLNGVNDTAEVGGNTAGSVTEDHTTTASGTVTASDRDAGDTGFQTPASLAGTYGDFHFNAATGAWSYDLNNASDAVQALGAEDTRTETLEVYSKDGTAHETITVTIHGDNDAPEFDGAGTSGSVTDTPGDDTFAQVTGTVVATDKDASDTLTYGLAAGETGTSAYGSFAIDAHGNWTFTPNDAAVEGLKNTTTVSFNVAVGDGHTGSDTETATITLDGVNDTAVIAGTTTGSVTEDGSLTAGDTLTVSDRDDTGFQTPASLVGTYGDFTFNASTGQWGYTLRNGDANVQALNASDTRTDTLTVKSADGSDSDTITVTIHGANDAPPVDTDTSHDYDTTDVNGIALITSTSSSPGQPHQFNGTNAADTIVATNDPLNGDTVNAQGGGDTVYGRAGNDSIQGMAAGDTIYGGSGNDSIIGGAGGDHLWGGSGNDTFVYSGTGDSSGANGDTIHDFHHGYDHIDLQGVYGGTLAWGGSSATANGVWFTESGGNTVVHVDVTGAPAGDDMLITLSGTGLGLTSADFLL